MPRPDNHQAVMPYILVDHAEKFLAFSEAVFDANQTFMMHDDQQRIRHAEVNIDGATIMFANATDKWPAHPCQLFVYVSDADASYQRALDHGATSVMELSTQDYGRTCGIKDPCGNTWWITSVIEK